MKILYAGRYNLSENLTGPEKTAKRIFDLHCGRSPASRDEIVFAEYFFDGTRYGLWKKLFGREVYGSAGGGRVYRLGLIRFVFFLFHFRPEYIHIITYERFGVICFLYRLLSRANIIYNVHGIVVAEDSMNPNATAFLKFKDRFCEKIFFDKSDKLIFHSKVSVSNAAAYYSFKTNKVFEIPNGVDDAFHQVSERRLPNTDDSLRILFCGDIAKKEKGFEFFQEIISLARCRIEVCVVTSEAVENAFSNDMNANVNWTFVERMNSEKFAGMMADMDIFVSSSMYEQFSIAAAEAMSAGLVPIVTDRTGMSYLITHGRNGFVHEYGDAEKFSETIELLNSDRKLLSEMSAAASEIYHEISWNKILDKYLTIYS